MPIEITDMDHGKGVLIRASGFVTDDEYKRSHVEHLSQDVEKLRKYLWSFSDWTEATGTNVTTGTLQSIVRMCLDSQLQDVNPVVAIAGRDDLIYGMGRMFESLAASTSWKVGVFHQRDEAENWIKETVQAIRGFEAKRDSRGQ